MYRKHCGCPACAGAFEIMPFAPRDSAEPLGEEEAMALVAELFAMESEAELDLFLGKLVKRVGRAAGGAAKAAASTMNPSGPASAPAPAGTPDDTTPG